MNQSNKSTAQSVINAVQNLRTRRLLTGWRYLQGIWLAPPTAKRLRSLEITTGKSATVLIAELIGQFKE